jgi:hypothetical protein
MLVHFFKAIRRVSSIYKKITSEIVDSIKEKAMARITAKGELKPL